MKPVRLQSGEKILEEIETQLGVEYEAFKLNLSRWPKAKLIFTNNRIIIQSKTENFNYNYKNVSGLEVTSRKLPPRMLQVGMIFLFYMILAMIGVYTSGALVLISAGLALVSLLVLYLGFSIKTYNVTVVSNASEVLISFDIKREEEMIQKIEDAYENAQQNS